MAVSVVKLHIRAVNFSTILQQTEIMNEEQVKIMNLANKIFDRTAEYDSLKLRKIQNDEIKFKTLIFNKDPLLLREYSNYIGEQIGIFDSTINL
jgi:hypothetical protein